MKINNLLFYKLWNLGEAPCLLHDDLNPATDTLHSSSADLDLAWNNTSRAIPLDRAGDGVGRLGKVVVSTINVSNVMSVGACSCVLCVSVSYREAFGWLSIWL